MRFALILALLLPLAAFAQDYEPAGLQLTVRQDPSTTVVIDWHVLAADEAPELAVRELADEAAWRTVAPDSSFAFPFSDRLVRRAELTGLTPNTAYAFRFADGKEYRFRTLPADLREPVRLAVGGDVRHERGMMDRTARVAMRYDPHLVVFGGDLAYANGDPRRVENWYDWFEVTRDAFVTPEGFQVAILAGIGNHEVFSDHRLDEDEMHLKAEWGLETGDSPFYTTLFPLTDGQTYFTVDLGESVSFVMLDTDHVAPIEGEQTAWLDRVLAERAHVPHVFPVYHVPGYPSVRSYDGTASRRVREQWVPLFEQHGVRVAFENHDHSYKRTVPLREGREHPNGIVYVGDGAWGVSTREIGSRRDEGEEEWSWYLAHAEDTRHAQIVTLHGPMAHILVVSEDGEVIDEWPRLTPPVPSTETAAARD